MNTATRILWLPAYRPGFVATLTRGVCRYVTEADALAQIARFKRHFPGNRYYTEPFDR